MDGQTLEEHNEIKDQKEIYVAVGSLSLVIIVSVAATVLVRRKKKEKKEETVTDQNIVYGSEDYYEGSDLTDKNEYYDWLLLLIINYQIFIFVALIYSCGTAMCNHDIYVFNFLIIND